MRVERPSFFINIPRNSHKYKTMLPSDIKNLYEAYNKIYAPKFETILDEMTDDQVDELTDDLIEEVIEEVFYEYLEEGYEIDDIETVLVESLDNSITALNEEVLMELNPYAPAGSKESGAYNKATTQSKRSAASAAKRAETIEKVKGAVKKVGSKIKQKAAGAAVSAYAAGKMAKGAAKTAGKAALSGAGEAAGKAVKYAKKAGQAVSSGYKKGSEDSSEEESTSSSSTSTSSKSQAQSSQSSGSSGGSIRRAAGSLLKKGVKKVLGLGARAVAGTARGVHSLADKAAKRLGEQTITEDPVQDYRDMQRAKQNASGMRGPELSHSANSSGGSAAQKPQPRSREFEKVLPQPRSREFSHGGGSRPLKSVVKGGLTMSYEPKGKSVEEGLLDIGRSAAETAGGMIGANKGRQTGIPGAGKVGEVLGRQRGGQMYDKVTEPLKGRIPGFNKGGTVKKEEVEIVDENIQAVVKTGLDKASNFMKTNPVGKAASAVLAPVGSGRRTPTATSGGYRKEQFDTIDENVGGSVKLKPGSGLGGGTLVYPKGQEPKATSAKLPTLQNAHYEPEDIYDLVMEYLLDNGHAESISEAHYVMTQLDEDAIQSIFEETTTEKLARRASEKADEPGAKTEYKPEGPRFKNPRSKASVMNQIAGRAKTRAHHGVDSQYASQSEQPRRGGRSGRGSKTDRPGTANMPNPNRKPKG